MFETMSLGKVSETIVHELEKGGTLPQNAIRLAFEGNNSADEAATARHKVSKKNASERAMRLTGQQIAKKKFEKNLQQLATITFVAWKRSRLLHPEHRKKLATTSKKYITKWNERKRCS